MCGPRGQTRPPTPQPRHRDGTAATAQPQHQPHYPGLQPGSHLAGDAAAAAAAPAPAAAAAAAAAKTQPTSSWRCWSKWKTRWRTGRKRRRWTRRTAKRRRKTRRGPGHSCPCSRRPPRGPWPRQLWRAAGCHRWPSGTSAARSNVASLGGSVGRSPLWICRSRSSPSAPDRHTDAHKQSQRWRQNQKNSSTTAQT